MVQIVEVIKALLIAINPSLTRTINVFESIAIFLGIIGMFLVYFGIHHAEYRRDNLEKSGTNGILMLIADENIRVEKERRAKMVFILLAAGIAASVPSSTTGTAWAGSLISLALIGLIGYVVKGAWNAFEYRRRMDAYLEQMDRDAQIAMIFGGRRKEDLE
jgi:hypothetical protein